MKANNNPIAEAMNVAILSNSIISQVIGFYHRSKLAFFLLVVLILNLTAIPDIIGRNYFDQALQTSAAAFVTAKILNGAISVLQESSVSIGAVISVNLSPGQMLDPLNDLVENFADILLLSTASLGIQKILLTISGAFIIKILAAIGIVFMIYWTLNKESLKQKCNDNDIIAISKIYKAAIVLLVLRFLVPFVAIASTVTSSLFLDNDVNDNLSNLQEVTQRIEQIEKAAIYTDGQQESSKVTSDQSMMVLQQPSNQDNVDAPKIDDAATPKEDNVVAPKADSVAEAQIDSQQASKGYIDGVVKGANELMNWVEITTNQVMSETSDAANEMKVKASQAAGNLAQQAQTTYDQVVEKTTTAVKEIKATVSEANPLPKINSTLDTLGDQFDVVKDNIINLISLFLLQVIIFPLIFLYILMKIFNRLLRTDLRLPSL